MNDTGAVHVSQAQQSLVYDRLVVPLCEGLGRADDMLKVTTHELEH